MKRWATVAVLALSVMGLSGTALRAEDTDPADLAFWQSVQNSTNPAEYKAYLDAFPHGRFVGLAKIRAAGTVPAATPVAQPQPQAAPEAAPVDSDRPERIVLTPTTLRPGQLTTVTCTDWPQAGSGDKIIIVAAGSPDVDPDKPQGSGVRVLWYDYASNCNGYKMSAGPFAPGRYEARFMTSIYNNDKRKEVGTRTPFSVH